MAEVADLVQAILTLTGQYDTRYGTPNPSRDHGSLLAVIPYAIAQRVTDWGMWHVPDMELYSDGNKNGRAYSGDVHITLKYGLETSNPMDVIGLIEANKVTPFDVTLGKSGIFEKDDCDVVILGVTGGGLAQLHDLASQLPSVPDTYPEYHPHVTVAYVKKGMGRAHIGNADFNGQIVKIDRVTFSRRDGRDVVIPLHGVTP